MLRTRGRIARSAFKKLIELREQHLQTADLKLPIAAGMQAPAEVLQGQRAVMEYQLSPVQKITGEAAMERCEILDEML